MSGCGCGVSSDHQLQKQVLWQLLLINFTMFVVEAIFGWLSESSGLLADALDMLADATVYGVALYVIGRTLSSKINAAYLSGMVELLLGLSVLTDIVRRMIYGSEPESLYMITISTLALAANLICLRLLTAHKEGEVHMRATWIFTRNDVLANLGVIIAGLLVWVLGSPIPDWIIGLSIAMLVLRGAVIILQDARSEAALNN